MFCLLHIWRIHFTLYTEIFKRWFYYDMEINSLAFLLIKEKWSLVILRHLFFIFYFAIVTGTLLCYELSSNVCYLVFMLCGLYICSKPPQKKQQLWTSIQWLCHWNTGSWLDTETQLARSIFLWLFTYLFYYLNFHSFRFERWKWVVNRQNVLLAYWIIAWHSQLFNLELITR